MPACEGCIESGHSEEHCLMTVLTDSTAGDTQWLMKHKIFKPNNVFKAAHVKLKLVKYCMT